MTTAITRLITWLKGEPVGTDDFGNRYFQERKVTPASAPQTLGCVSRRR